MKFKKILTLGAISSVASLPLMIASCGSNTVDSSSKIKQDKMLSSETTTSTIEQNWLELTLTSLYNIEVAENQSLLDQYQNNLENVSAQSFKDAYLAFSLYAQEKMKTDAFFFNKLNITLTKNADISSEEATKLNNETIQNEIPSQELFKIYWKTDKSGVRQDIDKMLLVYKYLTINDVEQLKKVVDNFKEDTTMKFAIKHYLLSKYALDKKMVQIWQKTTTVNEDSFWLQGYGFISSVNDFNAFFADDAAGANKILLATSKEKLTNNEYDTQLKGYSGFETSVTKYGLYWDYDTLSKFSSAVSNDYSLTGFYSPAQNKLISNLTSETAYSPYNKDSDTTDKAVVVYVNQIAPIGQSEMTNLPISEGSTTKEDKRLLSFENTPYADKLDVLSFLFHLKDANLYSLAKTAFSKLGHKIKLDKSINTELANKFKDVEYVELVDSL
ncbi:HinT-interacting membrane complex lipoprotein P60 [Mycoplasmopsis iners]|uniref:HinT-interacting membrane complex lipoprotein P60 n=1 Tax=Mycoplasmopsis iners TaxID=76630 RepID=UPI000496E10B|nr:variable surface lipoprotein [Mycoplasmopsis iners]